MRVGAVKRAPQRDRPRPPPPAKNTACAPLRVIFSTSPVNTLPGVVTMLSCAATAMPARSASVATSCASGTSNGF